MTSPQNPGDQMGTEFLWENDYVKVWTLDLQPGEASEWHHHHNWYVITVTKPGTLRAEYADGTSREVTYTFGEVQFLSKDSIHRVINIGDTHYSNSIVELKGQE